MYHLVLGLEIHIQLNTKRKMFCGCDVDIWKVEPNTHTCPTCLGLPGALPVPNAEAVRFTQMLGLALGSDIKKNSKFDRKHYFYPDLPKGYQISQYKEPLCEGGRLELSSGKVAEITRIHLEEDTAKSFHEGNKTLIDFNKSGIALMELVTEPCFENVEDAVEFSQKIREVVRFLGISDADMEKGNLRIEPNISLRTEKMRKEGKIPNYKVEIKNINSFKFMEKAVKAEVGRQQEILKKGRGLVQENRGYDENTGKTVLQRSKEEAHDYRYFPEPDIPPMEFDEEYLKDLKLEMPKLPEEFIKKLVKDYRLAKRSAEIMVTKFGMDTVKHFEKLVASGLEAAKVANLLLNNKGYQNLSVDEFKNKMAEEDEKVTDETELMLVVNKVVKDNSKAVKDYKSGKEEALQFLLGMVMRETKGKAEPVTVIEIIKKQLG